jgi:hypothetical protein
MSLKQNPTTKTEMADTRQRILCSMELLTELAGIALHGLAAPGGGEQGWEGLDLMLKGDLAAPWNVKDLQEGAFQGMLRLAGQAWKELNDCEGDLYRFMGESPKGAGAD